MRVSGLRVHPVKSTAIRPVQLARVTRAGLEGDREWMVVDAAGELVSARELPALFGITADVPSTGADVDLVLRHPGSPDLVVRRPQSGSQSVTLFGDTALQARAAGAEADRWLRIALGREDLTLVWCADPTERQLNPRYSRPGDHTAFADGYPVNVLTHASVAQLQDWIDQTTADRGEPRQLVPAARFRANIEIEGAPEPFAEDSWRRVLIGEVTFRAPRLSARCVMTTVDPEQPALGAKEPLRTLSKRRRWDHQTWFAANLIPEGEGIVRVGDELTVLENI